jgi:hypothetical protein
VGKVHGGRHQFVELRCGGCSVLMYTCIDGQCVCQVTLEDELFGNLQFLVVPFNGKALLDLGACRHLHIGKFS